MDGNEAPSGVLFFVEVKAMKKCESCIWVNKVNEMTWVCKFPRCLKMQGFKVDNELKNTPRQNM
ncbi:hypothetical protein BAOM_2100 [Peribacillus asahii]|uniref:Uncharacterized protein n=1 Tax=Peribacillus asahii TaxID=228899 RepID=A0A3T0KQN6_9BACI|nr:hypothetical protein BAOM_2100 [Peribacillus asahii]